MSLPYTSKDNRVAVFADEKQFEDALNTATFQEPWGFVTKGSRLVFGAENPTGEIISEEAQAVLDAMPTPLTGDERTLVINFVNSQSVSLGNSNWALIDSFVHFGLADPVNALFDWKRLTGMTNTAAVHSPGIGYVFNGTSAHIDSGYVPGDGINYKLNDALVGCFNIERLNDQYLTSVFDGGDAYIALHNLSGNTTIFINSATTNAQLSASFINNSLYVGTRSSSRLDLFENGISIANNPTSTAVTVPTRVLYIGARNNNGSVTGRYNGTISSFIAGAAIGFDQVGYNTTLRTLNDGLAAL